MDTCLLTYADGEEHTRQRPAHAMHNDEASPTSKLQHTNELQRRLSFYPSTTLSELIPVATAALRASSQHNKQPITTTPFARALAKVRVQVQSKRLKEKYLAHEWIRLALSLPVDESVINSTKGAAHARQEKNDRIAIKKMERRTGEIAMWYEWKLNKQKFTVEQVETKVDQLRAMKLEQKTKHQ